MKERNWWIPVLVVAIAGAASMMFMGIKTYRGAPPIPDYVEPGGGVTVSNEAILRGQDVFKKYALMQYGTMFGDGGARGPDFTAEALHVVSQSMIASYERMETGDSARARRDAAVARVQHELKENTYRAGEAGTPGTATISPARVKAWADLAEYYRKKFREAGPESVKPTGYIDDDGELRDLAAFFFWGSWVCSTQRPDYEASYTHNWPYDPEAGNVPGPSVLFWSVLGAFALILGVGAVLYIYGRMDNKAGWRVTDVRDVATTERVDRVSPSPTQRATYKFFAVAVALFLFQVLAGVLTIHDFVNFTNFGGLDMRSILPLPVTRSWHVQISVLWISTCWIGASIFVLPRITRFEPPGQLRLVNLLFALLATVVIGTIGGSVLGPMGALGEYWRLLGNQGWEFQELGRLFQYVLMAALLLWAFIVYRGVRPALSGKSYWTLPHWILYTVCTIAVLYTSAFVAGPKENFVIADFWRWCVIHMWAECFFEVFTTVLVGYFLYAMGLVAGETAKRVVFLAVLLFWGTGFLGIAHNFYWNAKPVETLAIGAVFSTMQVIPLILLTFEAWKFRQMPLRALARAGESTAVSNFGLAEAFLFLIAVNFWNFFGAGVFGFIINLPIVNYYEHGTYLTVNHGHAALMGVYGNLSIAGVLFCTRFLVEPARWPARVLRVSFWSMNIGLLLMVLMDTFPAGLMQLFAVLERGMWYARSQAFIQGDAFQTLTWLRAVGGALFVVGGVAPLVWFMHTRGSSLREAAAPSLQPAMDAPALSASASRESVGEKTEGEHSFTAGSEEN